MTPFEKQLQDYKEGKLALPVVSTSSGQVDSMLYQLAVTKYQLGLYAAGMLPNRHFKITPIKQFFGLKGNDRKKLLSQFEAILEAYKVGA